MITRRSEEVVLQTLTRFPVVGLIGARQVGKTTLARAVARRIPGEAVHLDLEKPSDLAKLADPELYLSRHSRSLVILDEVQRRPDLFPVLRALVDADRRPGRFLLLGSASPTLMRTSSESLAGRIFYHELPPLGLGEIAPGWEKAQELWVRGGFPLSFLATTDRDSLEWRSAFIATHLERDLPGLGIRVPASALRRFWMMLAHSHGQMWNAGAIAGGLGVSAPTVRHYLDILQDTFMVRQISPWSGNLKKRLVKRPKVYLRDSGLLHALLGLGSLEEIMGHPAVGNSWEGWVIEQVLSLAPPSWRPSFYRTAAGAEIDLLLERPGNRPPLMLEVKLSLDPSPARGFWAALEDFPGCEAHVICPAKERFPLGKGVSTLPVLDLPRFLTE
jgi:uncharacterized protein